VSPASVVLEVGRWRTRYDVVIVGERPAPREVHVDSAMGGPITLREVPRFLDPADQVATGSLLAPMPGSVVSVAVGQGDQVRVGQPVLVLEAMKMQHTVTAPHDGTVTELLVSEGQQVASGAVLAVVHVSTGSTDEEERP
jgi:propionyl-CoA carboxylase alpha chain